MNGSFTEYCIQFYDARIRMWREESTDLTRYFNEAVMMLAQAEAKCPAVKHRIAAREITPWREYGMAK